MAGHASQHYPYLAQTLYPKGGLLRTLGITWAESRAPTDTGTTAGCRCPQT